MRFQTARHSNFHGITFYWQPHDKLSRYREQQPEKYPDNNATLSFEEDQTEKENVIDIDYHV